MKKPLKSLVERGLAERYKRKGKERTRITRAGRRQAFKRMGLEGKLAETIYRELKALCNIEKSRGKTPQVLRLTSYANSYAKMFSFIITRLGGKLKGKKILEIGPGKKTAQLQVLKNRGAEVYTIEPHPPKELRGLAKNARTINRMQTSHFRTQFDVVYSRGVFEPYSAKEYLGLRFLKIERWRKRFLKKLAKRIKPGGILVFSAISGGEKLLFKRRELEEAGFQIIVDSLVSMEKTREILVRGALKEHFMIARKKP